jgi:hypothetical protein
MPHTTRDDQEELGDFGGLDPEDECYASVEAYVEEVEDDETPSFDWRVMACIAFNVRRPRHLIRLDLEGYGLRFVPRENQRSFHTVGDNRHDRWAGNPCAGGSGWEQIEGFAGKEG